MPDPIVLLPDGGYVLKLPEVTVDPTDIQCGVVGAQTLLYFLKGTGPRVKQFGMSPESLFLASTASAGDAILEVRRGAALGVASLDAGTKVPVAQISEVMAIADLSDVASKSGTGTAVLFQGSPTITTPTIASFVNAQHGHTNSAGGGTISMSALTGVLPIAKGGTALGATGSASQFLCVSASGSVLQYRTLTATTNVSVAFGAGTISITGTTTPTITSWGNALHAHTASTTGGQIDHSSITGCSSGDQHDQYTKWQGRTTGQTIIGALASAGTITIQATASTSAGAIIFKAKGSLENARFLATGELIIGATTLLGTEKISVQYNSNSNIAGLYIKNTNPGTLSTTALSIDSDGASFSVYVTSSGFTAYGDYNPSSVYLKSTGKPVILMGSQFNFISPQNASATILCTNTTAGTLSTARYGAVSDTIAGYMLATSSTFTPSIGIQANEFGIWSNGGNLFLEAYNAFAIRFLTGGTEKMRLLTGGTLILSSTVTTAIGSEKLRITGSQIIDVISTTAFTVAKNTGSGAAFTVNTTTGYCVTPTIYGGTASGGTITIGGSLANNPTAKVTICGSAEKLAFFGAAGAVRGTSGEDLTNNVTASGTTGTIEDFSDLSTYATDAVAIRRDIYQLARKLKQVNDSLRAYGMLT
jgi:hypothetical protein